MNREEIEKIFPYEEQSIMMFTYTAFIELLKYQKPKIINKTDSKEVNKILWNTYLIGIINQMTDDITRLQENE